MRQEDHKPKGSLDNLVLEDVDRMGVGVFMDVRICQFIKLHISIKLDFCFVDRVSTCDKE